MEVGVTFRWSAQFRILTAACLLLGQAIGAAELPGHAAPELDALFQRTNGWAGADGNYSIPLSSNTTLWLFSDTWVGAVANGRRSNVTMINNSIALQRGTNRPEFFYRTNSAGKPASFIVPQDGRGYFWLFHGARTTSGLWCFLQQMESNGKGGPFGFRFVANWVGHVENPDDPPPNWGIKQTKFPFDLHGTNGGLTLGGAVIREGDYIYVGGTDSRKQTRAKYKSGGMILARVSADKFGDFNEWRFYGEGNWQADFEKSTMVAPGVANEFSLSYLPGKKKYAAVYMSGTMSGPIVVRLAEQLEGPWSEAQEIFRCPEREWPVKVFCYAAKAHPELSPSGDELIITYASNAWDFWDVMRDARIYWPRFVRVPVAKLEVR
jgi:hypothetical protein